MSQPYIGEIRMFGGTFAPAGWALCQGQLMPISENESLFNLIGTTYGGDGQETFGLPDLQGRVPVHMGQGPGISQNYVLGEEAGVETVTLNTQQIPIHPHTVLGSTANGADPNPAGNFLASSVAVKAYAVFPPENQFANTAITSTGGSQPHENLMPYLCISFIISLFGIFPSQT
jgi:microcystin-dependent protein